MSQDLASFIAVVPMIVCIATLALIISERTNKGTTELLDRICAIIEYLAPSDGLEGKRR